MMTGPTRRFSMIGKGGPMCALAGTQSAAKIHAKKPWMGTFLGTEIRILLHTLTAHQRRGPHLHGLENQPNGSQPNHQRYSRPGNEHAHGVLGAVLICHTARYQQRTEEAQDQEAQLNRLHEAHGNADPPPMRVTEP